MRNVFEVLLRDYVLLSEVQTILSTLYIYTAHMVVSTTPLNLIIRIIEKAIC